MNETEIKRKLKARVAVRPGELPARALGLSRYLLLQKISLLSLGWQTGAGAATLNINDNQRQLRHYRQTDGFRF